MIKSIEKTYMINEDEIILKLSDIRDNYIHPTSLGDIGDITIYLDGAFINCNTNEEEKIVARREQLLKEAFKEVFGREENDPLSREYYPAIKAMIKDGTLKSLGYKIKTYEDENIIEYQHSRH